MKVATGAALLAAVTAPYPSLADEFVQKGVHEHGRATLTLAVDGAALTNTLEAPAANVVGFEHPPKTADESAAVIVARRLLNDPGQFVGNRNDSGGVEAGLKQFRATVTGPLLRSVRHGIHRVG